jgi:hypothetical protein
MVRGVNGTVLNDNGNPQIGRVGWREESGGRSDVDGLNVTPCCILGQERLARDPILHLDIGRCHFVEVV